MIPDLREHIVHALESDLVGPFDLDPASAEVLSIAPLRWYTAGFLAPVDAPEIDPSTDDADSGAGDDEDEAETGGQEPQPKAPRRLPSSIGLSILLPKGPATDAVDVTLSFGEYLLSRAKPEQGAVVDAAPLPPGTAQSWQRRPSGPLHARLPLDPRFPRRRHPDSPRHLDRRPPRRSPRPRPRRGHARGHHLRRQPPRGPAGGADGRRMHLPGRQVGALLDDASFAQALLGQFRGAVAAGCSCTGRCDLAPRVG